jgi:hypothetical protein
MDCNRIKRPPQDVISVNSIDAIDVKDGTLPDLRVENAIPPPTKWMYWYTHETNDIIFYIFISKKFLCTGIRSK